MLFLFLINLVENSVYNKFPAIPILQAVNSVHYQELINTDKITIIPQYDERKHESCLICEVSN